MDTKRKGEIKEIAQNVSNVSEQFQLIHATYACQMLIKQMVIDEYTKKYDDLLKNIEKRLLQAENMKRSKKKRNVLIC